MSNNGQIHKPTVSSSAPIGAELSPDPWESVSNVAPTITNWLAHGRIPFGAISLIEGKKGVGKSTLLSCLAASASGGDALPDSQRHNGGGCVIWLAGEEDVGGAVRPRLAASGAILDRIVIPSMECDGRRRRRVTLPHGIDVLYELAEKTRVTALIADPYISFVSAGYSMIHEDSARAVLEPLAEWAGKYGVAVVLSRHLRKGSTGDVIDAGLGSTAVGNVARSILRIDRHPDDDQLSILSHVVINGAKRMPSLLFSIASDGAGAVSLTWEGQSKLTTEEVQESTADLAEKDATSDATSLLKACLAHGWRPAKEILTEAKDAGVGERTLRKAKAILGIPSRRVSNRIAVLWEWGLPPNGWPEDERRKPPAIETEKPKKPRKPRKKAPKPK